MDKIKLGSITVLVAGTLVFLVQWWRSRTNKVPRPPSNWCKVGEIGDICVFPIKSLGYIRVNEVQCTLLGCKRGWMRDRTLMLIDSHGRFVTARKYPKMILISPSIEGSILTLRAAGLMEINVDLANVDGKRLETAVWGHATPACDCGDEVARWLSHLLLGEDVGLRLVYYPLDGPCRDVKQGFPLLECSDAGAYTDETSYSLMNLASIEELNTRLEDSVTPLHFRMNFMVKGATAFEEDNWDWIKIGSVVFRNVRPCTRCLMTTIHPQEGIKHSKTEPLTTLKKYRQIEDPAIRPLVGESPALGIHLGLKGREGIVRLGDNVYVGMAEDEDNRTILYE